MILTNLFILVSWGSRQCGITKGSIYVNISQYLDWIQEMKLKDAILDYELKRELPYEKLDNGMFHALFEKLATLNDTCPEGSCFLAK